MATKRRLTVSAAASFGAAMATMNSANDLQAAIVNLSFAPASVNVGSGLVNISINQLGTSWSALNNAASTIYGGFKGLVGINSNFSFGLVSPGQSLTPGMTFVNGPLPASVVGISPTSNPIYGAFRYNGNVGWFSISFNNPNQFVITNGAYGNAGESFNVGANGVPEPSSAGLALLALGAAGLRRRRRSL